MGQGEINRGRHTDHPAGRHSIRTNQWPPPPSSHFLQARCPSCRPTNSVKALKATSAFGLGRRVLLNGVTCTITVPYKMEDTTTQNKDKRLKPGLVALYYIWPENTSSLFLQPAWSTKPWQRRKQHGPCNAEMTVSEWRSSELPWPSRP